MIPLSSLRSEYDAVVVGARCAGAATAMLLARAGLRVLAVDRGRYGTDTLSTHALMRGAVLQLHRWNVLRAVVDAGTPAVRRTTFDYGDAQVIVPIKFRDGVDALFAPRRALLDRVLVDAAVASGATVVHGVRVVDLVRDGARRVEGVVLEDGDGHTRAIRARTTVGADGVHSVVARLAGAREYRTGRHATGVVYGHWTGVPVDGYLWTFREGIASGAIPTGRDETCVFVCVPASRFAEEFRGDVAAGYRRLLPLAAPQLAPFMAGATLVDSLQGFGGRTGYFREPRGPGWALVGDAGYFKDPLTAHGITDALIDAELLANAVVAGSHWAFDEYAMARDERADELFEVTDAVASFAWTLETVRDLHERLSRAMSREVKALSQRAAVCC